MVESERVPWQLEIGALESAQTDRLHARRDEEGRYVVKDCKSADVHDEDPGDQDAIEFRHEQKPPQRPDPDQSLNQHESDVAPDLELTVGACVPLHHKNEEREQ